MVQHRTPLSMHKGNANSSLTLRNATFESFVPSRLLPQPVLSPPTLLVPPSAPSLASFPCSLWPLPTALAGSLYSAPVSSERRAVIPSPAITYLIPLLLPRPSSASFPRSRSRPPPPLLCLPAAKGSSGHRQFISTFMLAPLSSLPSPLPLTHPYPGFSTIRPPPAHSSFPHTLSPSAALPPGDCQVTTYLFQRLCWPLSPPPPCPTSLLSCSPTSPIHSLGLALPHIPSPSASPPHPFSSPSLGHPLLPSLGPRLHPSRILSYLAGI
ncbi:hypothetical protein V8E53_001355 [Lactarius tabidus]